MTIKYYGKLFDNTRISPAITRAVDATKVDAMKILKGNTPVRTGKLRSGWSVTSKGFGLEYSNQTPYAIYVEMGTKHFAPRAMLERSIPAISKAFKKNLGKQIAKEMIKKVIGGVASDETNYDSLKSGYAPKDKVYGGFK